MGDQGYLPQASTGIGYKKLSINDGLIPIIGLPFGIPFQDVRLTE